MERVTRLAAFALVACQADRPPAPAAPAPPPPIAHDAAIASLPAIDAAVADDDPNPEHALIHDAFGGDPPAFPLLSPDGKLAALDLSLGLGMSSFSTYEVGLMNPQGAVVEHLVMVDHALADAMARNVATPAAAKRRMATVATAIKDRVATFTPFATVVDVVTVEAGGTLPLGSGKLAIETSETTGLDLRWLGDKGAVLHAKHVAVRPRQYSDRDGGRCGGVPKLESVWWDAARNRVLFAIVFPGHDSCQDEPLLWILF
jgi:hypothetical protein